MAERDFLLPDLGEGLEEAEVVSWLVAEGDDVALNQPIAEVETAKAIVEIPSPFAGRVTRLHAEAGEVVSVGSPLITIDVAGVGGSSAASPEEPGVVPGGNGSPRRQAVLVGYGPPPEEEPSGDAPAPTRRTGAKVTATPPVRKLARELGVDLAALTGSGPRGRITREDVERAASGTAGTAAAADAASPESHAEDERVPVRGVRRSVAEHMARSASEIPHVTTFLTVDHTWVLALRDELQADHEAVKITPLAVIAAAMGDVVRRHPKLNASFDAPAGEIVLRGPFHLGIATDTERGLLVPVVRDADHLPIPALAAAIREVVLAARSAKASPEQLTGSTFTITNVGTFGAEFGTPIINHPEAAILAVGVIASRALVVEGEVVARPAATLSLSFDHRVMDGAEAGRALKDLGDLLESPFRLGALPR